MSIEAHEIMPIANNGNKEVISIGNSPNSINKLKAGKEILDCSEFEHKKKHQAVLARN